MQLVRPFQLTTGDDGGLQRRQALRRVKNEMASLTFKGKKMKCGACVSAKAPEPRRFRTWASLRDHLIGYHEIDSREVPE